MNIRELPFQEDLLQFAICAEYAEPGSNREEQMNRALNRNTYLKMIKYKEFLGEDLKENPLIEGLMNLYLKAYKSDSLDEIKKACEEYYQMQQQYPFNENMQMYMDAGCGLSTNTKTNSISIMYPLYLYGAYLQNGGYPDKETRGGYLYPSHHLTNEEMIKLKNDCPDAVRQNEEAKKIFDKITNKRV